MLIPLSKRWNIRDLGGIENRDGLRVAPKRFIRAGCLDNLTDADWNVLKCEYNVRKVIDLRSLREAEERPDRIAPGVEYIHIPVFGEQALGISRDKTAMESVMSHAPDLVFLYSDMVCGGGAEGIRRAVREVLSASQDESVMFHCTAGKDRTGITAMLILFMLDVPRETVISDYMYTNDILFQEADTAYAKALAATGSEEFALSIRNAFSAKEEFICSALDAIENSGGMDAYIRESLGVSDRERAEFRKANLFP